MSFVEMVLDRMFWHLWKEIRDREGGEVIRWRNAALSYREKGCERGRERG
jgi:hypothetical protein